jgi:solute carrier family 35 (UDP-xylose/UDP-N-acetylglucosamine transporter), member B4
MHIIRLYIPPHYWRLRVRKRLMLNNLMWVYSSFSRHRYSRHPWEFILNLPTLDTEVTGEKVYSTPYPLPIKKYLHEHFLGIPFFIPLLPRILRDFSHLAKSPPLQIPAIIAESSPLPLVIPRHLYFLMINVATQYICVRGVNRLSAISSALTITIILNIRKFTSLALSVAIFGNKLATGVKVGAILVAAGAAWYAYESKGRPQKGYSSLSPVLGC